MWSVDLGEKIAADGNFCHLCDEESALLREDRKPEVVRCQLRQDSLNMVRAEIRAVDELCTESLRRRINLQPSGGVAG